MKGRKQVHHAIDAETAARLAAAGASDFESVMAWRGLEPVKAALPWKSIARGELPDGRSFFLKRYDEVPRGEAWAYRRRPGGPTCAAEREWRALTRLAELGVTAPRPLAWGAERRGPFGLVRRAFVLTEGLPEAETLEASLYAELGGGDESARLRRRRVGARIARLLAAMHAGGVNHRDFYAGHLRVTADDAVQVLDLDRADVRVSMPRRWREKDLAALHFSVPLRLVGMRERLRFAVIYFGTERAERRPMLAAVARRAEAMRRRTREKIARGDPNVHLNE
ncbi:MAG: lipopolysaccharide kinase InaA family protein [Planctomycetota bacterium]